MDTGQSKHRLLLVDGDPKSLRVLEVSLKKAGFEVVTAGQGREALAALQASLPDLIISDTDLEGRDGFDLCRQIKAKPEWAKIPFIFVSGRKSIEDKIRGLELGVDDYLTKPIYIKEIGIRVRTALQRAERERLESRREGRTRFAGDLADIGVVDLVQTIELNRKSGIIHIVNRDGRRGAVFFREGRVIDAEVGRLSGAEAMYRLFSWSDGRFEVEFKPIRRHDVIDLPSAALLMEGMRRLDEWTRLLEKLPALDSVIEVDFGVLGEQLADLPDEMNGILRLCDGTRSLLAVIDDSDFPDLEALTMANRLFEQGIIYTRELPGQHHEAEPGGELARWLAEGRADDSAPADAASAGQQTPLEAEAAGPSTSEAGGRQPIEDDVRASAERQAGKTLRTFSLDITIPSLDANPPANAARSQSTATPRVTVASTEQPAARTQPGIVPALPPPAQPIVGPSSPVETSAAGEDSWRGPAEAMGLSRTVRFGAPPAPAAKSAADGSSVMVKPDTLRGIPIPESIAEVDQSDPARQATKSEGLRAAHTTLEIVSSVGNSAPGAGPSPPSAAKPAGDKPSETDWGGWAQGSESQPAPESQAPQVAAPRAQASGGTPEGSSSEAPPLVATPSTEVARTSGETPQAQQADEASPMDDGAAVSDPLFKTQLIRRSPSLEKLGSELLPHQRRWPLLVVGLILLVAIGLFATRIRPTGSGSSKSSAPESPPTTAPTAKAATATAGSRDAAEQMMAARPNTAPVDAQAKATAAGQEPAKPPRVVSGESAKRPAEAGQPSTPGATTPGTEGPGERCRKVDAGGKGRPTAILAACRPAAEAEPAAADIMVILARVELDRGHAAESRSWAKKAIAVNPNLADAYVFLGGAEQEVGTPEAAKAAYKKYLELAPNGRHARELRTVLSSM